MSVISLEDKPIDKCFHCNGTPVIIITRENDYAIPRCRECHDAVTTLRMLRKYWDGLLVFSMGLAQVGLAASKQGKILFKNIKQSISSWSSRRGFACGNIYPIYNPEDYRYEENAQVFRVYGPNPRSGVIFISIPWDELISYLNVTYNNSLSFFLAGENRVVGTADIMVENGEIYDFHSFHNPLTKEVDREIVIDKIQEWLGRYPARRGPEEQDWIDFIMDELYPFDGK